MIKKSIVLRAIGIMALVWTLVIGVRMFSASRKITAERINREFSNLKMDDWSENPGSGSLAIQREKEIRRIAKLVNQLDFKEREKNWNKRSGEQFFQKLSRTQKIRPVVKL